MNTIKIVIVDDHKMFLDGLYEILIKHDEIEVVGIAPNGEEAMSLLSHNDVDLVISDLRMKNMDGYELSKNIIREHPAINILIVSMHTDPQIVNQLLKEGVTGYILKNTGKEELMEAIREVSGGKTYFSEEVKSNFINSKVAHLRRTEGLVALTKREKEVLQLIAQENTTSEIAQKLFISLNTVETHRKNILRKLQVRNSVGIVKRAMEIGLLD